MRAGAAGLRRRPSAPASATAAASMITGCCFMTLPPPRNVSSSLFDIDGTLVLTGARRHARDEPRLRRRGRPRRRARRHRVRRPHRLEHSRDIVADAGRHDWTRPLLDELRPALHRAPAPRRSSCPAGIKEVMPGIRALLDVLERRDDVSLGLLTGNFVDGARIKLEYFDLWRYFPLRRVRRRRRGSERAGAVRDRARARVRPRRRRPCAT